MRKTKFSPILFSTPMVQAILENRKTMTRRTKGLEKFNASPNNWRYDGFDEEFKSHYMELISSDGKFTEKYFEVVCPYEVGDVLWVRESFKGDVFSGSANAFVYKASSNQVAGGKWKPSIFMPKEACRIFLKIKAIRVERLQDISEEDIKNEGVKLTVDRNGHVLFELGKKNNPFSFAKKDLIMTNHEVWLTHWAALWVKINGPESWKHNPFVFVYEFEQIEKPLDFIV
jgi:hypothetical protein